MAKSTLYDKIIFLVLVLVGLGFLLTNPTGTSQTLGIAVTIAGLTGLISAHALAPLLTLVERNLGVIANFSETTPTPNSGATTSPSNSQSN